MRHGLCIGASGACRCNSAAGYTGHACGECQTPNYIQDPVTHACVRYVRLNTSQDAVIDSNTTSSNPDGSALNGTGCAPLTTRRIFSSDLWSASGFNCHPAAASLFIGIPCMFAMVAAMLCARDSKRRQQEQQSNRYRIAARATAAPPRSPGQGRRWLDRFPSWWNHANTVVSTHSTEMHLESRTRLTNSGDNVQTDLASTLPEGWHAATDTQGQIYYFNRELGETSWSHPREAYDPGTRESGNTSAVEQLPKDKIVV